jgi:hypothetical protein
MHDTDDMHANDPNLLVLIQWDIMKRVTYSRF